MLFDLCWSHKYLGSPFLIKNVYINSTISAHYNQKGNVFCVAKQATLLKDQYL
jgi:hypothetical protein